MTAPTNTEATFLDTLSNDEITALRRFIVLLSNRGVQATLCQAALEDGHFQEAAIKPLIAAIDDLNCTCEDDSAKGIVYAAPSLKLVADIAARTDLVPEDCIPSYETVDKCVAAHFQMVRDDVAKSDS